MENIYINNVNDKTEKTNLSFICENFYMDKCFTFEYDYNSEDFIKKFL